jgi:hypothetical protein
MTNTSPSYTTMMGRIDALVQSISDREQLLAAARSQIEAVQQDSKRALEEKTKALEERISKSLSDEIKVTADYTKELYTRFERMVWVGLVALAGVSVFIGYQTFSSIPDKINTEIAKISTDAKQRVDKFYTETDATITKRDLLLKNEDTQVTNRLNDLIRKFDDIEKDANRKAMEKVDRIATTYEGRFREAQIDSYLLVARGQSGLAEIISLLVQEFPGIDPQRQSRIAAILVDGDVPKIWLPI